MLSTGFAPVPIWGSTTSGATGSSGQLTKLQEYELLYPNQSNVVRCAS